MRRALAMAVVPLLVAGALMASAPTALAKTPAAREQLLAYVDATDNIHGVSQDGVQIRDLSTGKSTTLVPHTQALSPALSPDGQRVLFGALTDIGGGQTAAREYVVPTDGSTDPTMLDFGGCATGRARWSPDGSKIVSAGSCGLLVLDARTLQTVAHQSGDFEFPVFSADGSSILFSDGGGEMWQYSLATETYTLLGQGIEPVPSPDGTAIAYRSLWPASGGRQLRMANSDGSASHEIPSATPSSADDVTSVAWSADSSTLFVGVNRGRNGSAGNNDIFAVDRSGTFRRALTLTSDLNEDQLNTATTPRTAHAGGELFSAQSARRLVDTRTGLGTRKAPLGAGAVRDVKVAGLAGVPRNATAVTVNLAGIAPSVNTWLALVPTPAGASSAPSIPTLVIAKGQKSANSIAVPIGTDGSIRLYNRAGSVNATITGYFIG